LERGSQEELQSNNWWIWPIIEYIQDAWT
jgi:hypothetical protein